MPHCIRFIHRGRQNQHQKKFVAAALSELFPKHAECKFFNVSLVLQFSLSLSLSLSLTLSHTHTHTYTHTHTSFIAPGYMYGDASTCLCVWDCASPWAGDSQRGIETKPEWTWRDSTEWVWVAKLKKHWGVFGTERKSENCTENKKQNTMK